MSTDMGLWKIDLVKLIFFIMFHISMFLAKIYLIIFGPVTKLSTAFDCRNKILWIKHGL